MLEAILMLNFVPHKIEVSLYVYSPYSSSGPSASLKQRDHGDVQSVNWSLGCSVGDQPQSVRVRQCAA